MSTMAYGRRRSRHPHFHVAGIPPTLSNWSPIAVVVLALGAEQEQEQVGTRIFVGNLSYGSTEDAIGHHFEQLGIALKNARIIIDRETGRSRGFAFVELADESQLERAVREADGSMLEGRPLAVREAHDKPGPGGGGPSRGGFGGPRPSYGGGPPVEARRPMGDGPPRDRDGYVPPDAAPRAPRDPAPRPGYGGGGGYGAGGGYGGGGGGYGGGGGGGGYGGGGPSAPRGPGGGPPSSTAKRKPKDRDREGEGSRARGDESKRRRGFHGGRGYTEYEDDDD